MKRFLIFNKSEAFGELNPEINELLPEIYLEGF